MVLVEITLFLYLSVSGGMNVLDKRHLKSSPGSLLVTQCTWTDETFLHEQYLLDLLTKEATP